MKRQTCLYLLLLLMILITACSGQTPPQDVDNVPAESVTSNSNQQPIEDSSLISNENVSPQEEGEMVLSINGGQLDVQWEDYETVAELLAYVQNETITVHTTVYGGFEQVGSLPQNFSRSDVQITTEPGILCYTPVISLSYSLDQIAGAIPNSVILKVFLNRNCWSCWMRIHRLLKSKQIIRCNITADGVESWWLTWWIAWWVSPSKL